MHFPPEDEDAQGNENALELHLMEKDPPRYYRMEEYMIGKGLWKQL